MTIWDRGTYEAEKWSDREVKFVLHGSRVSGPLRAVQDRPGRRPELDDPPDGPAAGPGLAAAARADPADARRAGQAAAAGEDAAVGLRDEVGRHPGRGLRRGRPGTA